MYLCILKFVLNLLPVLPDEIGTPPVNGQESWDRAPDSCGPTAPAYCDEMK